MGEFMRVLMLESVEVAKPPAAKQSFPAGAFVMVERECAEDWITRKLARDPDAPAVVEVPVASEPVEEVA